MESTRGPRMGPSISDVARLAGVSSQTVSRVANGSDKVRPVTRDRVLAAMNQLGYTPNQAARALRRGNFQALGLLGHHFERTGEALTTSAVIAAATAEGYAVTIVTVDDVEDGGWTSTVSRLSSHAVDGLIILRVEETPEQLVIPPSLPVAVSDSRLVSRYPAVGSDHAGGSHSATTHLLELGHSKVHHISGPQHSDPAVARMVAWRGALERHGIRPPEVLVGDWSAESGYECGRRLAEIPGVTAVYCANDEMAIGALRAFHDAGLRVPEDVSVVGFDDLTLSAHLPVPLTTVRQDYPAIGAEVVRLVLEQIRSGRAGPSHRVTIPTTLVVRATTAPPPVR